MVLIKNRVGEEAPRIPSCGKAHLQFGKASEKEGLKVRQILLITLKTMVVIILG